MVVLPAPTPVNVNTAPREVLVAAVKDLDLATAERLIQRRQHAPFKTLDDFLKQLPPSVKGKREDPLQLEIKSSYFEVRGRLRLGDRVLEQISLVQRQGRVVTVIQRQRVSSRDQPTS
jgi:general secretion pathway protein K